MEIPFFDISLASVVLCNCVISFIIYICALRVISFIVFICCVSFNTMSNIAKMKRERTANFTFAEEVELVRLALQHSNVLECRKTDQSTAKMKNEKWVLITDNFNATASAVSIVIMRPTFPQCDSDNNQ